MEVWRELGYDFNRKNRSGKNCVFAACKFGHVEALNLLESYGICLYAKKPNGHTALGYALCRGSIDAFEYLLDYYISHNYMREDTNLMRDILTILMSAGRYR